MAGAFSLLRLFPNLLAGCSIRMRMSWPRRLRSWRGVSYKVLDSYVRGVISRARRRFRRRRSAPTSETRSLISISSRCAGIGIFCAVYGLLRFRTRPAGNAILPNGVVQIANREIGVPGLYPPKVLKAGCNPSAVFTGAARNDARYQIYWGSFSRSLARQKRTWRGINFLLPGDVIIPRDANSARSRSRRPTRHDRTSHTAHAAVSLH